MILMYYSITKMNWFSDLSHTYISRDICHPTIEKTSVGKYIVLRWIVLSNKVLESGLELHFLTLL